MPLRLPYAAVMFFAIVVGAFALRRNQRGLPLSAREKWGVGLGAFCGAMLGARLPYVLADWQGLLSGAAWFRDGKTILLGLVGGYLGVELAKWMLEVRTKTGDSFAVPVALSVGIGRLACFCGGCCYGQPTGLPWGVVFPDVDNRPRHPTQLYEAVFHFTAAAVLWQLQRRRIGTGQLIKIYIIAYCVYRFLSEFLRPETPLWLGLTGYQWAALALIPVFGLLWWRDAARGPSASNSLVLSER